MSEMEAGPVLPGMPPGCYGMRISDLPPPYTPDAGTEVAEGRCPACHGTGVTGPMSPGWPGAPGQPCPDCYGSGVWPPDGGYGHLVFGHAGQVTRRCTCDSPVAHAEDDDLATLIREALDADADELTDGQVKASLADILHRAQGGEVAGERGSVDTGGDGLLEAERGGGTADG